MITVFLRRPGVEQHPLPESYIVAFTQLPDTDLEKDLYRHPQARGVGRVCNQKWCSLYAMSSIIVELIMWKPLVDIFPIHVTETLKDIIAMA